MSNPMSLEKDPLLQELERLADGGAVLYVEDEEDVRNELLEILCTIFPRVISAENGARGLELFQQEEFLLVITDINMPEMNGIELIQEIQRFKPNQSIMVTSAYSDAKYLIPLLNLGVSSFILKPLNWKLLLAMLRKELSFAQVAEQEAKYQKRLEKEIHIRTLELQEAQAQILRLQEAKDNMLALLSHELRTPLNGILGFSELIRSHLKEGEALSFLNYIDDSAKRLERLTQKALDFASLSTGEQTITRTLKPLQELVASAWEAVCERVDSPPPDAPVVREGLHRQLHTDSDLAIEAMKNIFENAIKYAGISKPLEVSFEHINNWDILTIQDAGPGFSPVALNSLFQPFMSGNIMHHSEGMGLGLALTDVIMLTLGGKIAAGNRDEGGAWVKLYFPISTEVPAG